MLSKKRPKLALSNIKYFIDALLISIKHFFLISILAPD